MGGRLERLWCSPSSPLLLHKFWGLFGHITNGFTHSILPLFLFFFFFSYHPPKNLSPSQGLAALSSQQTTFILLCNLKRLGRPAGRNGNLSFGIVSNTRALGLSVKIAQLGMALVIFLRQKLGSCYFTLQSRRGALVKQSRIGLKV